MRKIAVQKFKAILASLAAALFAIAPAHAQQVLRSQTVSFDNYAALEAVPFSRFQAGAAVIIAEQGRAGVFIKVTSNQSTLTTADPGKGVFIPSPQDATGASGGYIRLDYLNNPAIARAAWFGAVGDGTTDDSTAINRCLSVTTGECHLSAKAFATGTTKITIGAGKTLVGDNSNTSIGGTIGTRLVASLSSAIVVEMDGGGGSLPVAIRGVQITRASGTIPSGSVGLKIVDGNYLLIDDVTINHHDKGIDNPNTSGNNLAVTINRAKLFDIDTTVFDLNAPQVIINDSKYGRNGATGLAVPTTVFNFGSLVDTFILDHYVQGDPSGSAAQTFLFDSYSNANGIFNITNSHFETFTNFIVTAGTTTTIQRLALIGNTATIPSGTTRVLAGATSPDDDFKQLVIMGNRFDGGGWTFDWPVLNSATITGNYFSSQVSLTGGSVSFTGNLVVGNIALSGAFNESAIFGNAHVGDYGVQDGGYTGTIDFDAPGRVRFTGQASPSTITSNQNDYAPANFDKTFTLRLATDASRNITGLAGGVAGRTIVIANVGSNDIVLKDEDSNSTAANRFALTGDVTISADAAVMLWYDNGASRWRVVGGGAGGTYATLAANTFTGDQTTSGQFVSTVDPGTKWAFYSNVTPFSLTNTSSKTLAAGSGIITVRGTSGSCDGQGAAFFVTGANIYKLGGHANWVAGPPGGGQMAVNWNGSSAYIITNNIGSTCNFAAGLFKFYTGN